MLTWELIKTFQEGSPLLKARNRIYPSMVAKYDNGKLVDESGNGIDINTHLNEEWDLINNQIQVDAMTAIQEIANENKNVVLYIDGILRKYFKAKDTTYIGGGLYKQIQPKDILYGVWYIEE